jgi:hypothetical protein
MVRRGVLDRLYSKMKPEEIDYLKFDFNHHISENEVNQEIFLDEFSRWRTEKWFEVKATKKWTEIK